MLKKSYRWRRMDTEPPTKNGLYIIYAPSADSNNPLMMTAHYDADMGWSGRISDYWTITHWTTMPNPPRRGK